MAGFFSSVKLSLFYESYRKKGHFKVLKDYFILIKNIVLHVKKGADEKIVRKTGKGKTKVLGVGLLNYMKNYICQILNNLIMFNNIGF